VFIALIQDQVCHVEVGPLLEEQGVFEVSDVEVAVQVVVLRIRSDPLRQDVVEPLLLLQHDALHRQEQPGVTVLPFHSVLLHLLLGEVDPP